tara:strand:- start:20 stop:331 length:312 start_codon:yes stop_codon:yes gene_type:complete
MKLANQIKIKRDCVYYFLRWLVQFKGLGELAIIDAVCLPHKFQDLFDEFRFIEYDDPHPMERKKLGSVSDLENPHDDEHNWMDEDCRRYHEGVDDMATRRGSK